MGINNFADFTYEEFTQYYNINASLDPCDRSGNGDYVPSGNAAPDSWDWNAKGHVTPVKD